MKSRFILCKDSIREYRWCVNAALKLCPSVGSDLERDQSEQRETASHRLDRWTGTDANASAREPAVRVRDGCWTGQFLTLSSQHTGLL